MWLLAALAAGAHAEPPRAEVFAALSGRQDTGQAMLAVRAAVARTEDASFLVRGTSSALRHQPEGDDVRVDTLGGSIGPGFAVTRGDLSLGVALGFGARREEVRTPIGTFVATHPEASVSGHLFWRPAQRAQLYGVFSFDAVATDLWASAGGTVPVLGGGGGAPAGVWLGGELTSGGTLLRRDPPTWGPVVEVPIRDLRAVLGLRAGWTLGELPEAGTARLGVGAYWWY